MSYLFGFLFGNALTLIFKAFRSGWSMKIGKSYSITATCYSCDVKVLDKSVQFGKEGYQLEVLNKKYERTDEIWLPIDSISRFVKLYNVRSVLYLVGFQK